MSDDNYCIEEDLEESLQREKRLEERVTKLELALIAVSGCERCTINDCHKCITGQALEVEK